MLYKNVDIFKLFDFTLMDLLHRDQGVILRLDRWSDATLRCSSSLWFPPLDLLGDVLLMCAPGRQTQIIVGRASDSAYPKFVAIGSCTTISLPISEKPKFGFSTSCPAKADRRLLNRRNQILVSYL